LIRRTHPDFRCPGDEVDLPAVERFPAAESPVRRDVAVDFVAMATVVHRMQSAFFRDGGARAF
jgi:hypothetical protein